MQRYHFRPYSPNQTILFPQRIDKDIADDDPVRLVSSIVGSLDLGNLRRLYKERGRSPYDPKMLLAVVIYAYMNNIYSCRKIEKSLKRDIHFLFSPLGHPRFQVFPLMRSHSTLCSSLIPKTTLLDKDDFGET